jgi:glycosyltransferase involved in cell wall biosynthesis
MTVNTSPHVSVVMPVFNGADLMADAIRSVQAQSYANWDLTIGNNRSTDGTLALAEEFAAADPRIRVVTYPEHVGVVDSHNRAVTLISDDAKYCKILGADDLLFPRCVEELIAVAEAYPTVGMVSSYVLADGKVGFAGLPYPVSFLSGRDVCRLRLLENIRVFGGPSSSLIRASVVRSQQPFYALRNYHGDNEAYLELLKRNDFGFVHQVLSYNRRGDKSRTTSYLDRVNSYAAGYLLEVTKYGPAFLSPDELRQRTGALTREYYTMLAQSALDFRGREFWEYHAVHMKKLGQPLSSTRLGLAVALRAAEVILNPLRLIRGIVRRARAPLRRFSRRRVKQASAGRTATHPLPQ